MREANAGKTVAFAASLDEAVDQLARQLQPGDVVLVLSAGDADQINARLASLLGVRRPCLEKCMSDDKRTFEAQCPPAAKSQAAQCARQKAKELIQQPVLGNEADEPSDRSPLPVTQDLILRLIKVLKET